MSRLLPSQSRRARRIWPKSFAVLPDMYMRSLVTFERAGHSTRATPGRPARLKRIAKPQPLEDTVADIE